MAFLERFRSQPKWKHRDPAVRLAAVEELPLEEQEVLAALAREDGDPRVRRAAVAKLTDLAAVAAVRDGDLDAGVREEAHQLIVDTALGAFEGTSEAESESALESIGEVRDLATIAKEASSARVAQAALGRIGDEKVIGSIARRSTHPSVRLGALARVTDTAELAAIALRTDFKDVAVAAVERISVPALMEEIANRAKIKAAARAARLALRGLEPVPAPHVAVAADEGAGAPAPAAAPDMTARAQALCEGVEKLAAVSDCETLRVRLANAEAAWTTIPDRGELAARFDAAVAAARARLGALEAAEAERARREEAFRAELAVRLRVVEQAESLSTAMRSATSGSGSEEDPAAREALLAGLLGQLPEVETAWQTLPAHAHDAEAARAKAALEDRFTAACREARQRHEQWVADLARRDRLAQLASEAGAIGDIKNLSEARTRWTALRQAWADAVGTGPVEPDLASRVAAAEDAMRAREAEAREARRREEREHQERLIRLAEEAEALAARSDLSLKDAEHMARDLKAAADHPGQLPSKRGREAVTERLRQASATLLPRLQELRDADEWQRWANATVQEDLCRKAEALVDEPDAAEAARQLRGLQAQWKKVTLVPRDQSQALWLRFKAAQDAVRGKTDAFFAAEAQERAANLARKEALCQKAEELAASSDWIRTAEAIKTLQGEWKTIGPVSRGQEKAIWDRFHAACDRFFTRRREDLTRRKEVWTANLARRQALVAEVDALGSGGDWDRATLDLRRIQGEWRSAGPVRRKHADDLARRFQEACARFQERYVGRDELQAAANVSARETACQTLEGLVPPAGGETPQPVEAGDVVARLREGWTSWDQAGPVPAEALAPLAERFHRAFADVIAAYPDAVRGTEFDTDLNRQKMEELCRQVEDLQLDAAASGFEESPAEILAARWREALAERTIAGAASAASEESRHRAAAETVRRAQAAWKRIGHVPEDLTRPLAVRFQKACARVLEQGRRRRS